MGHDGTGADWDTNVAEATAAVAEARERMVFTEKDFVHRRGEHPAKSFGLLHGQGQTVRFYSFAGGL